MLHFNLQSPVELLWFGEFISPEKGWKHLTRTLYEYELIVVTEGTLFIADEREEYEVHQGEYLIMSPTRCQHGTKVCRCRFYWLHFQCPALPASVSLPAHGKTPDGQTVGDLAERLFAAEKIQPRGLRSNYLASLLLLQLCEHSPQTADDALYLPPQKVLCEKVKNFVAWHCFSDIRIADLAKELGYHEKYLSQVFHATEGISLKRYLTMQRLREAERLLLETNYTIAEVAYYLNFQNPHNFSRFFKQEKGVSPVEYRKSQKSYTQKPI